MESVIQKQVIDEYVTHLSNLIKLDTTNPPGNEFLVARYLADVLEGEGYEPQILEAAKGRANLVVRFRGDGTKQPILLAGHADVVPAKGEEWSVDPFGGVVRDGMIWGRGSLDCKNSVALWLMIMLLLKRNEFQSSRDVIFLVTADEECGCGLGAKWMASNHPDLIRAEFALNEGGGVEIDFMGNSFITVETCEKSNIWLRLTVCGEGGHASTPGNDNPASILVNNLKMLSDIKFPLKVTPAVREFIVSLSLFQKFSKKFLIRQLMNPVLSDLILKLTVKDNKKRSAFRAMLRNTLTATVLRAGNKTNVIPSTAEAEIDFRLLPGENEDLLISQLKSYLDKRISVEILDRKPASESEIHTSFMDTIKNVIKKHSPRSTVVPLLLPAFTDSCFLRSLGTMVYGFVPLLKKDNINLSHGIDERVSIESLEFSISLMWDIIRELAKRNGC